MDKGNIGKRVQLIGEIVVAYWGHRQGVIVGTTLRGYMVLLDGAEWAMGVAPEEIGLC